MNTLKTLVTILVIAPVMASADARPVPKVANSLKAIHTEVTGSEGHILKINRSHPFTEFVIGIPVEVTPENACTHFVGQVETKSQKFTKISAMGAYSKMVDACIEIAVAPIQTQLTLSMSVLTGGIVMSDPIQTRVVEIEGAGTFLVTLDMTNDTVSVVPPLR